MTPTLKVLLGDTLVGYLANLPDDQTIFSFAEEYVEDARRPTLSQSFYDDNGTLLSGGRPVRRLAPPFFSNLLPEGGLRVIVARALGVSKDRDFPLLQYLGDNLLGAVRLSPAPVPATQGALDALAFALPGVQLKLSLLLQENDALTLPISGRGTDWIVKVTAKHYPGLVENEYAMLAFARAVGIQVPQTRLIDPATIAGVPSEFEAHAPALAVARFDRAASGERIHTEDLNQAFGQFPHDKYRNRSYADVARFLNVRAGQTPALQFLERIIFTAAIANGDMHLKNWSLIYRDRITPELAPAYDFISTLPYDVDHDLALSFGGSKGRNVWAEERLRGFARKAGLAYPAVRKTTDSMTERIREAWPKLEAPLLPEHRALIDAHVRGFLNQSLKELRPRRHR